jgi:hypothetical protein
MSDNCCQNKGCELTKLKKQQAKVLWAVLFINLGMFGIEFGAGIRADSLSLTGDSLDMLGVKLRLDQPFSRESLCSCLRSQSSPEPVINCL